MSELENFMLKDYPTQMESMLEKAIKFKFPKLKITSMRWVSGEVCIEFEEDGIHTKEMIQNFLTELRKANA